MFTAISVSPAYFAAALLLVSTATYWRGRRDERRAWNDAARQAAADAIALLEGSDGDANSVQGR